jgi:hypothetical protein
VSRHRTCTICGKPIVLVPSASERAKRSGETAEFYLGLFTAHGDCQVRKREAETLELIRRRRNNPNG